MATLAQLRTIIAQKIKDPYLQSDVSASVVDSEINKVIREYQQERFYFNTKTATITLTANEQNVGGLPVNLLSPVFVNSLMLIDNQIKIPLEKKLPDDFKVMDNEQVGRPCWYTYYEGVFQLLPIPQQDYDLKISYLQDYEPLVNDGDSNDFTNFAENLIILATLKHLYAENKDDFERASGYEKLEMQELKKLLNRSNDYNASGYLHINSIIEG